MVFDLSRLRIAKVTVVLAAALGPLVALPAPASAGGCFYAPTSSIAKALGLANATAYLDTPPDTTSTTPSVFSLCRVVAWSGGKPTTAQQKREKEANGSAAGVVIKTEDDNPSATPEQMTEWPHTWEEQTSKFLRAGALIYKLYHGKAFTPPGFGGRASAFTATRGPYRGAIGIWYNGTATAYVTIGITTSRVKHAPAALEAIAATAVPNFGF